MAKVTPEQPTAAAAARRQDPTSGNALGAASVILGLIGIVLSFAIVGLLPGVVAIVFGLTGRGRVKRGEATNRRQATTGLVLGTIAVAVALSSVVATIVFVNSHRTQINQKNACLRDAHSTAARQLCEKQFQDSIHHRT